MKYPFGYIVPMTYLVQQTEAFAKWHASLRDLRARVVISRRLERVAAGALGDAKSVGEGVSELRIDYGPGYRVYFTMRGGVLVILLCGGDKATQASDIKAAQKMAKGV